MAPPRKRRRQLKTIAKAAIEAKKQHESGEVTSSTAEGEVRTSHLHEEEPSGSLLELATQREDAPESE